MAKDKDKKESKVEKEDEAEEQEQAKPASEEIVDSAAKPYPHGNPPDPEDEFEKIHGFRRQT